MKDDSKELTEEQNKEIAKQTANTALGPIFVPEGSTVVKLPPRSREPRGPLNHLSEDETQILQAKVFQVLKETLPEDWEFMCCIMGPHGQKEVVGSVHGTNRNRKFLRALSDAMKTYIWRQ